MNTTYTPTAQEVAVFQKFVDENHILCDGSDQGNKNVEVIRDFVIGQMRQTALTAINLAAALPYLKDKGVIFKTRAQQALEKVIVTLTASERKTFLKWFRRQTRLVNDDQSDEAIQNAANILTFATSHGGANERNFGLALTNLPAKGIAVHYKPAPVEVKELGRHSGKVFNYRDRTNQMNNTVNHADDPRFNGEADRVEVKPQFDATEARWRDLANGLRGHTHSVNAELDAVTGTSWRNVYDQRLAIIRRGERVGR